MKFIRRQQAILKVQVTHIQELRALYIKNKQLLDSIHVTWDTYPEYVELKIINATVRGHIQWWEEFQRRIMDNYD